jgi:hypothetical protein
VGTRYLISAGITALLLGCTDKEAAREQADAQAAGFVPPSVTSRLDYGGAMERRFRALDRNGDEHLSKDELPARSAPRLTALDRNKDGMISAIEFSEGMLARFDRMDLNNDGTVTTEERQASHVR